MKTRISVGVIGCGYWGPNLVRNFRSLLNCQVTAVCDLNEGRLRHLFEPSIRKSKVFGIIPQF